MNIFDRIKTAKQNAKETDHTRYYKLLATVDINNPKDDEHATLDALLSRIGKTPSDAEKDRQNILRIVGLVDAFKATANASGLLEQSGEALQAAYLERQKSYQEQNSKVQAANNIHEQNVSDANHHQTVKGELQKLREADPILFAAVVADSKLKI